MTEELIKEAEDYLKYGFQAISVDDALRQSIKFIGQLTEALKAKDHIPDITKKVDNEEQDLHQCISLDRCYISGVKHGWNLGVKQDEKGFELTINLRLEGIREAQAAIKAIKDKVEGK